MSLALVMKTLSVTPPSHSIARRRPRAATTSQPLTRRPTCSNCSMLWPSTTRSTRGKQSGSRAALYANAATSGTASRAPACRLESEKVCASSNALTMTSPLERSSE